MFPCGKLRLDMVLFSALVFVIASSSLSFAFEPLFEARIDYSGLNSPSSVFAADLDGDSLRDLAVANGYQSSTVSIFLNSGDGTFQSAVHYSVGRQWPVSVFCADLDGDSYPDLAVANSYSSPEYNSTVSILLNNGDGTFQTATSYPVENGAKSVFCADLNGDLNLDLVVASSSYSGVQVLLGNGDGTFQGMVRYPAGNGPTSVFSADLDGDLDLDLAVAATGDDAVSILLNDGDGTFQTGVNYPAGNDPYSVFCSDLDGDLDMDLAVANIQGDNVSVLLNNGDGTFQTATNYPSGDGSYSVFCSDLDGDMSPDVAVANLYGDDVTILLNNGDGTLQSAVSYGAGDGTRSVFCADLDGDSDQDLAVANEYNANVSVFLNNADGTFQSAADYGAGNDPYSVFCADLDGDLDLDLAVANRYGGAVSILLSNGDGTFQGAVNYAAGSGLLSVFCADLDGDSDLDLAVADAANSVYVLFNNGDGTFQSAVSYGAGSNPRSVFCRDLDGDSDADQAVASYNGVYILLNNGDGTFQGAVGYAAGSAPHSVFCSDLDGDLDPDLAVANENSHNVSILLNNGDGTFEAAVSYGAGNTPRSVFCSDLDGDLNLDLAVANSGSDNVSILLGNGDGTFQSAVDYGVRDDPRSVFCADLNGDLDPDLAVANRESYNVSILLNNGDGTFQGAVNYGAGNRPHSVFCADLDADYYPDLAVANEGGDDVSVLVNRTVLERDAKAVSILAPTGIVRVDSVITPAAEVKNVGQSSVIFPVVFQIGSVYSDTAYVASPLDSGVTDTVTFAPWTADTLTKSLTYATACSTSLDGDMYNRNDAMHDQVTVSTGLDPVILSITPDTYGNIGVVTLNVAGLRFEQGARVKLTKDGEPDIVVDSLMTVVTDSSNMIVRFDLTDEQPGLWNVIVTNPDGFSATLYDGLTVETGTVRLWVDIVGRGEVRAGRSSPVKVRYGNYGNVDAHDLGLWIVFPSSVVVEDIDVPEARMFPPGKLPGPGDGVALEDDTVLCIVVNSVPVGTTQEVNFWIRSSQIGQAVMNIEAVLAPVFPESALDYPLHSDTPCPPGEECWVWYEPWEDPPVGSVCIRLTKGGGPGHVGVYVGRDTSGSRQVVDLMGDGYVRRRPLDDEWHDGEGGEGLYLGAFHPCDWQPGVGEQIAAGAESQEGYHLHSVVIPLVPDKWNCEKFVQHHYRAEGINPCWNPFTTPAAIYEKVRPGHRWPDKTVWKFLAPSAWHDHLLPYPPGVVGSYHVWFVGAVDPNDKVGTAGFDSSFHFVLPEKILDYIVFFENVDSATADAESIWIVDTLDADLDWSTLALGAIYPDTADSNRPDYNPQVEFDSLAGIITWSLADIDLPPDTLPPNGEGWVSFSMSPKPELPSGTQIQNMAGIKFDVNDWILAPMDSTPFVNTIDALPPTSQVAALADTQEEIFFEVYWSGTDDSSGSGIKDYTVYLSMNDGPYSIWLANTPDTSATFSGEIDHQYCFYSTALDNVGHVEQSPDTADACTRTPSYICGDCNGDLVVGPGDVVYLLNYLFRNGDPPEPLTVGDVNIDGNVDGADIVYLLNYLFRNGPEPCNPLTEAFAKIKAASAEVWLRTAQTNEEKIGVHLDAEFDVEVAGAQFEITWDKEKFELFRIDSTARTEKLHFYYSAAEAGEVKLGIFDISATECIKPGEGSLVEFRMKSSTDSLTLASFEIKEAILIDQNARKLDVKILSKAEEPNLPKQFSLSQNYPNPFNPQTVIKYALPQDCEVEITIYNILGQKVQTLVNEHQQAGYKRIEWDSKNERGEEVASGIYFYRIKAGEFVNSRKMVLLK